ncbi:30S ribosome-binding factor RbfA [Acidisoma cladoniae]|uniref:30S ribosome-binding factor RbfA n=1 Tax=Acidisoma cladoniae TaxID=3040935 RepID=UPI00254CA695|nr:30S ribosome-binding factor RbfA [Acidisoma sp. PAMC 29798]
MRTEAPTQRQLRVGEEIRHILSDIFRRDMIRDYQLAGVAITVTEVRVSPDLRNATAFVTRLGRNDADKLLPALKRAAPFLRGQVAKAIRLRVSPDLSFQADTSIDYAMQVSTLLHRPEVARDLDETAPRPE